MSSTLHHVYPLLFEPIYKEKVWGGRQLSVTGRTLPGDEHTAIGESWEVADLSATSATGGGGEAAQSVIRNGPLAGKTLGQAIGLLGEKLMGNLKLNSAGEFPLLVKYLSADENLSLQVHPSPEYVNAHPDAHLKSEAWYVVSAKPGALIYKGIQPGVTPEQFQAAIASNDSAKIKSLLIAVPVKVGDCHYLPSGTCHALGAGIVVAEAQTPSDTTFRVFDWGRADRQLHIDQALACMAFGKPDVARYEKRSHIAGMFTSVSSLMSCQHFSIEKVRMCESYEQAIPYDQPAIWMVLQGQGSIYPDGPPAPTSSSKSSLATTATQVDFTQGDTLLLPAKMDEPYVKLTADTVWLEIKFPQASSPLIA